MKRISPRSFPFLSAISTVGQHPEPTHIELRVERVDDRSYGQEEDSPGKDLFHASRTLTNVEALQTGDVATKTPEL